MSAVSKYYPMSKYRYNEYDRIKTAYYRLKRLIREWVPELEGEAIEMGASDHGPVGRYLVGLFGFESYDIMGHIDNWSDVQLKQLDMLAGPHGYAIFKAMKANA